MSQDRLELEQFDPDEDIPDDDDTRDSKVDNKIPILGKYLGLVWTGNLDILMETLVNSILTFDNSKSISDTTLVDILDLVVLSATTILPMIHFFSSGDFLIGRF